MSFKRERLDSVVDQLSLRVCRAIRRLQIPPTTFHILFLLFTSVANASPSATCTDGLTPLELELGQGIPLPKTYTNSTNRQVTFKVVLRAGQFFGPERVIYELTLPPNTGRTQSEPSVLPTFLHTPMKTDRVKLDVITNRSSDGVVGSCDYQLTLKSPPPDMVVHPVFGIRVPSPLIQVPIRMCVVDGAVWSTRPPRDNSILGPQLVEMVSGVNDQVWNEHAQIAFSTSIDQGFPVIEDPSPTSCNGLPGAVSVESENESLEAERAAVACKNAWESLYPGHIGQPVVFVNRTCPSLPGVARGAPAELKIGFRRDDDLCQYPRNLSEQDFNDVDRMLFSIVAEPSTLGGNQAVLITMAHELGHNLFLGHGDGLDDDIDSAAPGIEGSRYVDEYCDHDEGASGENGPCGNGRSLMTTPNSVCPYLSPYQVELARTSAILSPGAQVGQQGLPDLYPIDTDLDPN